MTDSAIDIMDLTLERRRRLATTANPGQRQDYVVRLNGVAPGGASTLVTISYVPDRLVLPATAFEAYLGALDATPWSTLEALALAILADVNNELIPRWAQVRAAVAGSVEGGGHSVIVEDRQPGWDNPLILERLPPL